MAQDVALFGTTMAVPAHLAARYADTPSNIIVGGGRGPELRIKGQTFNLAVDGQVTKVVAQVDGEEVPRKTLPVVILDYAVKSGRSWYKGDYDPNETKEPECYSLDGVAPEDDSVAKQSPKCAGCKWAEKGSKQANGKQLTACSQHRILAVIPAAMLKPGMDFPVLRLRISQTSNYDGKSPELRAAGKFALDNYLQFLKGRSVPNTRMLVTAISFDPNVDYPKLTFEAKRFVEEWEADRIEELMASGKVEEILLDTGTMAQLNGTAGTRKRSTEHDEEDAGTVQFDEDGAPVAAKGGKTATRATRGKAAQPKAEEPKAAAPAPAPAVEEDDEDKAIREAQERKAAKAAAAAAKAKAAEVEKAKAAGPAEFKFRAQAEGEDDDDYAIEKATARKAFVRAQANAAVAAEDKAAHEFFPPPRQEGEDEDDYSIRVAQARKAFKAGKPVVAAPVRGPKVEIPDDDAPAATPAPSAKGGKGPAEPVQAAVPAAVSKLLENWNDD